MIPDIGDTKRQGYSPLKKDISPTSNKHSAEIAIVSDAPTWSEVQEGRVFSGPPGVQFSMLCSAIQMPQHQIYFTSAVKAITSAADKKKIISPKGKKHDDWGALQKELIDELAELSTDIIVLMGDIPIALLLDSPEITTAHKHRGSIYRAKDFPHLSSLGEKKICISNHPSACSPKGDPKLFYVMINDFNKFLYLIDNPTVIDPDYTLCLQPTMDQVQEYYQRCRETGICSFDIEATPQFVTCFSIAPDEYHAISVPLMNNRGNYWSVEEEVKIWQGLADILGDPTISKVMQNGMFDTLYMLRRMNIFTENFSFDTMLAQHLCWTDLPKGLDFLTSVYTYLPYYKDDGKTSHLKLIKDWDKYWRYSALDAIATLRCVEPLKREITKIDAWHTYEHIMQLHKPLIEMTHKGIKMQPDEVRKIRERMELQIKALQHGLDKYIGKSLNINSSKQLVAYFYGELALKPYINRKTKNPTTDTIALHRIAKKGKKGSIEAKFILKLRKLKKLVSTYFDMPLDPDNRLRADYKISGTTSGRLASAKSFFGTGMNLQNQPPIIKKYMIPDDGYLLFEADLAKAEAHAVAYLAQDENMMEAFISNVDVHTYNASKIFSIPLEEVTKDQRAMGKRVVHASNYNMGPRTFSDNLATQGIFMPESDCKALLNAYHKRFPGLHRWHRSIEQDVTRNRILYNLFGRPKRFLGILNAALFRNAFSFIPQSTVAELLNRGAVKVYDDPWFDGKMDFLTTVHDSVVGQIPIQEKGNVEFISQFLNRFKTHMSHEFTVKGRRFTIGLDAKIGYAWGRDYVELPTFDKETIKDSLTELGLPH